MRNSIRIIVFSTVLAVLCSALLAMVSGFTAPYRQANEMLEEARNILAALEVQVPPGAGARELMEVFNRDLKKGELGELTLYEYAPGDGGQSPGVAIPFSGAGLWGPVSGVLALETDLKTIRGVRFYKQEETPGLGGEISSPWFQQQFSGKRIVQPDGEPGIRVLKPQAPTDESSVEGISGASMTSEKVQIMVNQVARVIEKERSGYVR